MVLCTNTHISHTTIHQSISLNPDKGKQHPYKAVNEFKCIWREESRYTMSWLNLPKLLGCRPRSSPSVSQRIRICPCTLLLIPCLELLTSLLLTQWFSYQLYNSSVFPTKFVLYVLLGPIHSKAIHRLKRSAYICFTFLR